MLFLKSAKQGGLINENPLVTNVRQRDGKRVDIAIANGLMEKIGTNLEHDPHAAHEEG